MNTEILLHPSEEWTEFQFPLRSENELRLFTEYAFGVRIPDVKICPHHCSPWQFYSDVYFERYDDYVLKGSRGFAGKSFLISLAGTILALTRNADISILGGTGEQAERVLENMGEHWKYPYAPSELLISEIARDMTFANGANIHTLMASTASVRGPHPQKLFLDEVDEIDKVAARRRRFPLLNAALGQPQGKKGIPARPGTIMASTHHYAGGTMDEVIKRARANYGWKFYEFCYKENLTHRFVRWERHGNRWRLILDKKHPIPGGWLSAEEVERKRNEVPETVWKAEYENQEPNPESRAIAPEAIDAVFNRNYGEYEEEIGRELIFEEPVPGARYSSGADWGKKVHETWIPTIRCDVHPFRLVALLRITRQAYHLMTKRANERVLAYRGVALHDKTGVGEAVDEMLNDKWSGFEFSSTSKGALLNDYIVGLERGDLIAPYCSVLVGEHRGAMWEDIYSGGGGHLPDSMSGMALAFRGALEYAQIAKMQ